MRDDVLEKYKEEVDDLKSKLKKSQNEKNPNESELYFSKIIIFSHALKD